MDTGWLARESCYTIGHHLLSSELQLDQAVTPEVSFNSDHRVAYSL